MVAASSALLLLNGTAAIIGPMLAGSLIAAFGPPAYFATLATLTSALAVYDLWRKSRAVPPSQKEPFVRAEPRA
jgi:ribose/xylose/arabinose/galactoside ABC-type transport system permease subunit